MSVPEGWGKCTIPAMGSEEYRARFCDPNKKKDSESSPVEENIQTQPEQQEQPNQIPQADAGNRNYFDKDDGTCYVLGED
jgi:hypothetical protein